MVRTAIVGAGPAGLLFALIGKIMMGDRWTVRLYDKRETYVRSHRLRIAPEPYVAIRDELRDPRFDQLMEFLEHHHFSPEVNLLEAKLSHLLGELGVRKELREIATLKQVEELDADTIVGADSVHSTIRELVRGAIEPHKHTHERVARIRVVGPNLPTRLNIVDQYRLSKVLGSVVDYRLNSNGFAEVDLFLTEEEHAMVRALGASPKEPVEITSAMLEKVRAPLFRAIVEHLEHGDRKVLLQSTFQLEHAVMPRVSFNQRVFLVGDAAVSLPFFRGMACLGSAAHALARAHATGELAAYDRDVATIVAREVAIVRSRAQLVRGLRELIRVSSLLPFPIQSWWLSAARDPEPDRMSPSAWFNLLIALAAAGLAATSLFLPWLWIASLPVQIGGGIAYRWTLDLEPGPHRNLRRIWEVQIAAILVAGVVLVVLRRMSLLGAAWWWILGLAFAAGIYTFEGVIARRLRRAQL